MINIAANSDSGSLLKMEARHSQSAPFASFVSRKRFRVRRLDDLGSDVGAHSAPFLKIDTQTYERGVLRRAPATIAAVVGIDTRHRDHSSTRALARALEHSSTRALARTPQTERSSRRSGSSAHGTQEMAKGQETTRSLLWNRPGLQRAAPSVIPVVDARQQDS
jgi:hypothetical protein